MNSDAFPLPEAAEAAEAAIDAIHEAGYWPAKDETLAVDVAATHSYSPDFWTDKLSGYFTGPRFNLPRNCHTASYPR